MAASSLLVLVWVVFIGYADAEHCKLVALYQPLSSRARLLSLSFSSGAFLLNPPETGHALTARLGCGDVEKENKFGLTDVVVVSIMIMLRVHIGGFAIRR